MAVIQSSKKTTVGTLSEQVGQVTSNPSFLYPFFFLNLTFFFLYFSCYMSAELVFYQAELCNTPKIQDMT